MDDIRPLVYFRSDFGGWCQVTLALITLGAGAGEPLSVTQSVEMCQDIRCQRFGVSVSHAGDTRQRHETWRQKL